MPTRYVCGSCEATFDAATDFYAHTAADHPGRVGIGRKQRVFVCSQCGAEFIGDWEPFGEHVLVHHPDFLETAED